jgi:phosphocarrier protein HPr
VTEDAEMATATRQFKIENQYGIHARPAAMFVKVASRFDCDISVEKDGVTVSGKSIMGLMTLEAGRGAVLQVSADGTDCEMALDELEALFDRRFDEE